MTPPCDRIEGAQLADLLESTGPRDAELDEHIDGCAECSARLEAYRRIAGALPNTGASYQRRPDAMDRVWAEVDSQSQSQRRRRWLAVGVPAAAAIAAAIALIALPRAPEPGPAALSVEVVRGDTVTRGDQYTVGDRLRARATAGDSPHTALRIYRNDRELLLACPPSCVSVDDSALRAELELDGIGRYQIVWLRSTEPLPAPAATVGDAVARARERGITFELRELDVR